MSKKSRASPTSLRWLRIIVTGGTFIKRPWGKARTVPYRRTRDFSSFLRASGLPTVGRRRGKIFILQPRYRYLKYTGVCSRPRHSYEILDKRSAAWEGIGWAVPGLDTTKLWLQRWFSPGLNGAINTSFSIAEDENTRVPSCTILRTVGLDFASRLLRRLGSSPTATSKFANDYLFRETTSHMRRISQLFIIGIWPVIEIQKPPMLPLYLRFRQIIIKACRFYPCNNCHKYIQAANHKYNIQLEISSFSNYIFFVIDFWSYYLTWFI